MREMKTPAVWLADCGKKIPPAVKAAFFGALICGMMAHLYQFTNKLYNYDELAVTPAGYGIGAEAGRWFLKLFGDYTAAHFGNYSLPFFNGLLSLLLLSVSAALVAGMFQMKDRFFAVMVGGFMTVFPAVICMFFFMYTAVFYSIGIFFSVLAAFLLVRFPKKIIVHVGAAVLIACSLGTYQAYFSNTVCLLLINVILMSAFQKNEESWKRILFTALRYLGVLIAGLILYLALHKVLMARWGLSMVNYQGLDSMGQISFEDLAGALKRCYHDIIALCNGHVMYLSPTSLLRKCFAAVMLLFAGSAASLFMFEKGDWIKKIFMVLGFFILPIALFLVYVMSPNGWSYTLMGYAVVFLLVFLAVWVEQFSCKVEGKGLFKAGMQWIAGVLSVVMLVCYIWYANGCYMALEYTKYHDMAYYETMVTQIKSLDGYTDDMPVAFIGNTIEDSTNNMGSMLGGTFGLDGKIESNVSAYSYTSIITKYLGFAPVFCGYEEIVALMELEEVKEMSCYPDSGSMKIVDGTVVIKLSEYE